MDDQPWVEFALPVDQFRMPADLHAVPATALPMIELGKMVTWGVPGAWWLVDGGFTVSGPTGGPVDSYRIQPFSSAPVVTVSTDRIWLYEDAVRRLPDGTPTPATRPIDELEPWSAHAWFDRLSSDDLTPPMIRKPRPARELPSLIGRQLRLHRHRPGMAQPGWEWVWAISEPLNGPDGEAVVRVLDMNAWFDLMGGKEPSHDGTGGNFTAGLNTLWAY